MGSFINISCTTDQNVLSKEDTVKFLDLLYENLHAEIKRSKIEGEPTKK